MSGTTRRYVRGIEPEVEAELSARAGAIAALRASLAEKEAELHTYARKVHAEGKASTPAMAKILGLTRQRVQQIVSAPADD